MAKKTQIVVVGGGAGGLELVTRLGARFGRRRHDIILVERNRTHIWKPLLHEVAAGSLDANLDEVGYRSHCHRWGYRFFMGALQGIDRAARENHDHKPSMLQDVLARRPTEIDVLNGGIVRAGERAGVPTPLHMTIAALIAGLEAGWSDAQAPSIE